MTRSDDVRSRFGIHFSIVARRWRRELEAALAEADLSDATWSPLVHLHETGGGLTQKQLAALVGVDASTLVRLVDILETRGLITRTPDPMDGRARILNLTPQGLEQVLRIRSLLDASEAEMLVDLDDAQLALMMDALCRIDARLTLRQQERVGREGAK